MLLLFLLLVQFPTHTIALNCAFDDWPVALQMRTGFKMDQELKSRNVTGRLDRFSGFYSCALEKRFCVAMYAYEEWDEPLHVNKSIDLGFLPAHCTDNTHARFVMYGHMQKEFRDSEIRARVKIELFHNCTDSGYTVRAVSFLMDRLCDGEDNREDNDICFFLAHKHYEKNYDRRRATRFANKHFKKPIIPSWTEAVPMDTKLFVERMEPNWYSSYWEIITSFLIF